jgi:hypothetical protein
MQPIAARDSCPELATLCERLVPGAAPPLELPLAIAPHARPLECFDAVERQVETRGGSACFGWQLWEWPALYLEAEFHAVWRDGEGALHDITPKLMPVPGIRFLPDPARTFAGRRVNNVRVALTDDPLVAAFLEACDEEWRLLNRGPRAALRTRRLSAREHRKLLEIRARMAAYGARLGLA